MAQYLIRPVRTFPTLPTGGATLFESDALVLDGAT